MKQIPSFTLQTQKLDGRNRIGNWYRCCIQANYPNGTSVELDLRVPHSKLSEAEQAAQNLLLTSSTSQLTYLKTLLEENLHPLNATIFAVRLHRLSLSEESEDQPLSA